MKKSLLLSIFVLFTATVMAQDANEVVQLSKPVQVTDSFEVYGDQMDVTKQKNALSLKNAISQNKFEQEQVFTASITQVCQKKGCFFIASDGDVTARVTFKDYGFFIPTNTSGLPAVFTGILTEKTLTVDEAKHYAEDAGNDPDEVTDPQKEYSVVASSILISKSK
jgi:hypothetical protein